MSKDNIISKLYFGELYPAERNPYINPEYTKITEQVFKLEEKITNLLPQEKKELYNEIMDKRNSLKSILIEDSFIDGFRYGVKLMIDCIYEE